MTYRVSSDHLEGGIAFDGRLAIGTETIGSRTADAHVRAGSAVDLIASGSAEYAVVSVSAVDRLVRRSPKYQVVRRSAANGSDSRVESGEGERCAVDRFYIVDSCRGVALSRPRSRDDVRCRQCDWDAEHRDRECGAQRGPRDAAASTPGAGQLEAERPTESLPAVADHDLTAEPCNAFCDVSPGTFVSVSSALGR